MNRPELYQKTVDILYQAYFNDTLEHGSCYSCAIGNMIAANMGISLIKIPSSLNENKMKVIWDGNAIYYFMWHNAFYTDRGRQRIDKEYLEVYDIKKQIESTGYLFHELTKIEYAFETVNKGTSSDEYMFNGLVAVLEVLKTIHEVTDDDLLQKNTERFKNHYATLTI